MSKPTRAEAKRRKLNLAHLAALRAGEDVKMLVWCILESVRTRHGESVEITDELIEKYDPECAVICALRPKSIHEDNLLVFRAEMK